MTGFQWQDFQFILPEMILVVTAMWLLIEGVFQKNEHTDLLRRFGQSAVFALIIALLIFIFQHPSGDKWVAFGGQLIENNFVYFAKILVIAGSAAVLAISLSSMVKEHLLSIEYSSLILLATVGMLVMVAANDFMSLFVGLEMQALSLYILAALNRDQALSSEAALKYFVLGALATTLYLYGSSLMYGFSGSTNFDTLTAVIQNQSHEGYPVGLFVGLIFIIAALSFKVSAVPFHMWTPDVYEGCPTPITAYIAAAPKVAAMVVFLRLLAHPFIMLYGEWQSVIMFMSFASMTLGAFAALRQTDLKRLLAYSAIGQMGYVLLGVASGNSEGVQAVFVYLTIYLIMIIGTFGCLLCLRGRGQEGVKNIEDLSGLSLLHPKVAFALAVFMFSLAGIPPLAGFFAKFYIFKAAISAGLFGLAIVGVLTSVVAAYYYLKIVKVMYFNKIPESPAASYGESVALSGEMTVVLNLCVAIILLFFMFPNTLLKMAEEAALAFPS